MNEPDIIKKLFYFYRNFYYITTIVNCQAVFLILNSFLTAFFRKKYNIARDIRLYHFGGLVGLSEDRRGKFFG